MSSVSRAHRRDLNWSAELRPAEERAPSLIRFAPTMIARLVVVVSSSDLADPDLWRHIKFGADMSEVSNANEVEATVLGVKRSASSARPPSGL